MPRPPSRQNTFTILGVTATVYGAIVAMFMGGSAIGGVFGGVLADRWGRRRTITFDLVVERDPIFLFFRLPRAFDFCLPPR